MRALTTILLIGLLLVLAAPSVLAKKHKGINFPKKLGSFLYQKNHNYEKTSPGLGVSFSYNTANGVAATIYVYDMNLKDIKAGIEDDRVGETAVMAAREIAYAAEEHKHTDLDVSNYSPIQVGGVSMWRSDVSFKDTHGNLHQSLTLVCGYKNNFFKVRITGGSDKAGFDEVVAFFLYSLGNDVLKPVKTKGGLSITVSEERMGSANGSLYLVYALLKQAGDNPFSFETEYGARELVALAWADKDDDSIDRSDEGLVELSKVYEAGYLKEHIWVYARNYAWDRPNGLRLDAFEKWRQKETPEHQHSPIFR